MKYEKGPKRQKKHEKQNIYATTAVTSGVSVSVYPTTASQQLSSCSTWIRNGSLRSPARPG